jgi:hypothetical protein
MQGQLGADNSDKLRAWVLQRESGGKYDNAGNQFGFIGGYQFGAPALEDVGLLKSGTSGAGNRALDTPGNWTIPDGKAGFLSNPALQDQAFNKLAERNYRTLTAAGVINANTSPGDVAGYLAAAHLIGAGGVINKGLNATDANGTAAKSYFQGAKSALGDKSGLPPQTGGGSTPPSDSTPNSGGANTSVPPPPPNTVGNNVVVTSSSGVEYEEIPVPFPNPLGLFSSYNCIMTLSSISAADHRRPLETYKAGKLGNIVLRSAGAGSKAQETAMISSGNPSGKYDFYIDNLEIQSIISFDKRTKGSNATDISFDVYEPYSMGIFLQSCELAARKNDWIGYLGSIFLLTIEFVGYDDSGNSLVLERLTRNIPMIIKDISMSMSAKGSVYKVKAHPSNEIAFSDQHSMIQSDISVSGKTVKEILQDGEFSLQNVINKRLREIAETSKIATAQDEIVIVFPDPNANDADAISGGAVGPIEGESSSGATLDPNAPSTTNKISLYRPTNAGNLIQPDATVNSIGKSAMDLNESMGGETEITKQNEAQSDPKAPINRKNVVNKTSTRQFMYKQGSTILNAISSILLKSKYCIDSLNSNKVDTNGMIDWFRIETQVDYYPPKPGNVGNNVDAKLIIYKIVPYKVHYSKIAQPGTYIKGFDKLRQEAAKEYDYIYTGKNTEIINFELEFPRAFFTTGTADNGLLNGTAMTAQQNSAGTNQALPSGVNNTPGPREVVAPNRANGQKLSLQSDQGGSSAGDHRSAVANKFQSALYDSKTDMLNATLTIAGDPYYLADSGYGNFNNTGSGRLNVTANQAIDYQSGEVDIIVNFRSPLDYSPEGIMEFGESTVVQEFSGLYKVNFVHHKISRGKFTQELKLQRRINQYASEDARIEALLKDLDKQLDEAIAEFEAMKDPNSPNYSSPGSAAFLYTEDERSQFDNWLG